MVTLNQYLYGPRQAGALLEDSLLPCWANLLAAITGSVARFVLESGSIPASQLPAGSLHNDSLLNLDAQLAPGQLPNENLHDALDALTVRLAVDATPNDLQEIAVRFSTILETYQRQERRKARSQSNDLYKIFTTLNEALLLLAAGSKRTVGRLKQLEVSLERAATIDDIAALKTELGEIVTFIREEARQEHVEFLRSTSGIEHKIRDFRQTAPWLEIHLPDRDSGIATLAHLSASGSSESQLYAAVFVFGRIREIARRYGDSVANELIIELVHRRLHLAGSELQAFRWSLDSVVIFLHCPTGLEEFAATLESQIESPFQHRVFLGARAAVLRVALSWVVFPGTPEPPELIHQIDRFVRENS